MQQSHAAVVNDADNDGHENDDVKVNDEDADVDDEEHEKDDCGYGDHVSDLEEALGVVGQRTPNGLTFDEFTRGLEEYRRESEQREAEK